MALQASQGDVLTRAPFCKWKLAIGQDPVDSLKGICYLSVAAAAEVAWWQGDAPKVYELFGLEVREGPEGVVRYSLAEGTIPAFGMCYGGWLKHLPSWKCEHHQREEAFAAEAEGHPQI